MSQPSGSTPVVVAKIPSSTLPASNSEINAIHIPNSNLNNQPVRRKEKEEKRKILPPQDKQNNESSKKNWNLVTHALFVMRRISLKILHTRA